MPSRNKKEDRFLPAIDAPKYALPVVIGRQGVISENFLYDPEKGVLVHTVAMQRKGAMAIGGGIRRAWLRAQIDRMMLAARLFVLKCRIAISAESR